MTDAENEAPGAWAQKVMFVMAHPDDVEFSAGGTIAKWVSEGKEVYYVLFTRGDKGSSDPRDDLRAHGRYPRGRAARGRPRHGR